MSTRRGNQVTRQDAFWIALAALAAGVAAATSGTGPTAQPSVDFVLTGGLAMIVTWLGASAAGWALLIATGISLAASIPGRSPTVAVAAAALLAATWATSGRINRPLLRAVIAGACVNVVVRLEWDPRFLGSAAVAAVVMSLIAVSGLVRRPIAVQRRVVAGALAVGLAAIAAVAALGVASAQAAGSARRGYDAMLDGLELVESGDVGEASVALRTASEELREVADDLAGPLAQPSRFVPVVAQNRSAVVDIVDAAAVAAGSAADALSSTDLDAMTISHGVVDVVALAELAEPLRALEAAIIDLGAALSDSRSAWLVTPLRGRIDEALDEVDRAARQAGATALAAEVGPDMLGASGTRRYFIAFVNGAESRGTNGLMGNWTEVTVTDGRLLATESGRTAALQSEALRSLPLDMSPQYLERYEPYGAVAGNGMNPKYWANVTVTPDMPSVGDAMAQMYTQVTGREVDGVFVIDPSGIAALLDVTGGITLPESGVVLTPENAERFLTVDQYQFAESEREDLLASVTEATILNFVTTQLPPPQQIAPALGRAALNGHLSGWAARTHEQELFAKIGMDAALPRISDSGTDGLAVTAINQNGNKIDSFLQRSIEYRPVVDQRTGDVEATLIVTITNAGPTSGYPDYVIGNFNDEPRGTNRMNVDVFSRLGVDAARLDGRELDVDLTTEAGYNVFGATVVVAAGESVVLELDMSGSVGPGDYRLAFRPQPLPNPDEFVVVAREVNGEPLFSSAGQPERRTLFQSTGEEAWR
jgi:hypothetical protein